MTPINLFLRIVALLAAASAVHPSAQPFELLVTQSPPGPSNQNPATWSGILQYHLTGSGATLAAVPGVDKSLVSDPAGLIFRGESSEVFVGNRHGNTTASSISRFKYDPLTRALTANGSITGNGLFGVHQLAINPITGELFAANVNDGVSRFTFDATGNATANGKIASGPVRGVAVSPDGKRLYLTTAGNVIRQFDLTTGSELPAVTLATQGNLHYIEVHRGELYAAALNDNLVYRYAMLANNDLALRRTYNAFAPIDVTFSPDGREMFVSGHRESDEVYRFNYDENSDDWVFASQFSSGSSLGALLVLPNEPQLTVSVANEKVRVAWTLPDDGWVLETIPTLTAITWTTIQPPYEQTFQERFTLRDPSASAGFFRLKKIP